MDHFVDPFDLFVMTVVRIVFPFAGPLSWWIQTQDLDLGQQLDIVSNWVDCWICRIVYKVSDLIFLCNVTREAHM